MTNELQMNRADLERVIHEVRKNDVDVFTLIRHSETSIGYLLDMEFRDKDTGKQKRIPIVGVQDW